MAECEVIRLAILMQGQQNNRDEELEFVKKMVDRNFAFLYANGSFLVPTACE